MGEWPNCLRHLNEVLMKIGLDLHGVIDAHPEKFVALAKAIIWGGGQVIICTGSRNDEKLINQLLNYNNGGKWWTNIFSITDYLIESGVPHTPSSDGGVKVDNEAWDRVKGDWAKRENIDFHIDDSPEYGKYFEDGIYLKFNDRINRKGETNVKC